MIDVTKTCPESHVILILLSGQQENKSQRSYFCIQNTFIHLKFAHLCSVLPKWNLYHTVFLKFKSSDELLW